MTSKSKTLIFFGSGPLAARSLDNVAAHFNVGSVITKKRAKHHKYPAPVETLARHLGINIIYANNRLELDKIFEANCLSQEVGLVIDYGVVISKNIIDYFNFGILNSHFSLLPEWRGPDPITYSLLSGQSKSGVSLMLIDEQIDTGMLIAERAANITIDETNESLTEKLINISNDLININLPLYLDGQIVPYSQKVTVTTHSTLLSKQHGQINTSKPASILEREIRAYSNWPGSYLDLNNFRINIIKAREVDKEISQGSLLIGSEKTLLLGCRVGALEIIELKPAGKKTMSSSDFINGYSKLLI